MIKNIRKMGFTPLEINENLDKNNGNALARRIAKNKRFLSLTGFTLVELVIVLVILAILVGVALPAFTGARAKAYRAEALPIMSEIKAMGWCYRLQYGNDTNAGWSPLASMSEDDGWRAIGYSLSDKPVTSNFRFRVLVRGDAYMASWTGVERPGDCGPDHGACFIIRVTPLGAASQAGASSIYMVMNYTSGVVVSYTDAQYW